MRLIFYLLLVILLYSCREATSRLEQTLQLAGDNKLELQKVLDHYASDSLKLKAAIFLIENMPGHYSLDGPYLRQLQRVIDSTGTPYLMKKVILMQPLRYPYSRQQLRAEPDLEQVKADYTFTKLTKPSGYGPTVLGSKTSLLKVSLNIYYLTGLVTNPSTIGGIP